MKNIYFPITLVALFLITTGCSKEQNSTAKPSESKATQSQTAVPEASTKASGASTLEGTVSFQGTYPKEPENPAKNFAECKVTSTGDRHKAYQGTNGKLGNVFIYIKEGVPAGNYPTPSAPVVLDQVGCAYTPRVLGMMVGQTVDIFNSDPTLHNVHTHSKNSESFNTAMPLKGMKISRTFAKPEVMVEIKCDVHGWMRAYAGVMTHPFFAVSKNDGSFSIGNLPAGTYTVAAWHEKLGTQEQKITVADGEAKSVTFSYSAK